METQRIPRDILRILANIRICKCEHCGHIGADVLPTSAYVGGRGYVTTYLCKDRPACWKRWENQHGEGA